MYVCIYMCILGCIYHNMHGDCESNGNRTSQSGHYGDESAAHITNKLFIFCLISLQPPHNINKSIHIHPTFCKTRVKKIVHFLEVKLC